MDGGPHGAHRLPPPFGYQATALFTPADPSPGVADLQWADVVIIGAVVTVGFTLLAFAYSALMSKRNWTYQVKPKPSKKPDAQPPAEGAAPPAK